MIRHRVFTPVNLVFGSLVVVAVVLSAFGLSIPAWLQYLPFALSLVLFGLPHGALDHLVPARLAGRVPTAASVSRVVVLYLLLGAGVFVLWSTVPAVAFAFFIVMTWFHWGQGDLWVLATFEGAVYPGSRFAAICTVLVRGGLPMLVPLLAWPEIYRQVMRDAVGWFDPVAAARLDGVFQPGVRLALGITYGALVLVTFLLARLKTPRPPASGAPPKGALRRDFFEVALLVLFFTCVPPVLAVGLYFCLWHAVRHIIRLELLDANSRGALARGSLIPALRRFSKDAAPVTLVALAMLVTLYFVIPSQATGAGSLLGLYLVLISALTLPHVVIVSWMDRRQHTWR